MTCDGASLAAAAQGWSADQDTNNRGGEVDRDVEVGSKLAATTVWHDSSVASAGLSRWWRTGHGFFILYFVSFSFFSNSRVLVCTMHPYTLML